MVTYSCKSLEPSVAEVGAASGFQNPGREGGRGERGEEGGVIGLFPDGTHTLNSPKIMAVCSNLLEGGVSKCVAVADRQAL